MPGITPDRDRATRVPPHRNRRERVPLRSGSAAWLTAAIVPAATPCRGRRPEDRQSAVCETDPATHQCVVPYLDHSDVNGDGPHWHQNATTGIDGGKMDAFIGQAESAKKGCLGTTENGNLPAVSCVVPSGESATIRRPR